MKKLIPPTMDPYGAFQSIIQAKRGDRKRRLEGLQIAVRRRFDAYAASVAHLETVGQNSYSQVEHEDLEDCYLGKTQPLQRLLAEIVRSQQIEVQGQCQYCGISSPADSFDHYLPRSHFPEFSAYVLNLLPCCHTCNSKKLNAFLADGNRQIINLYFDQLPNVRYLGAQITYDNDVPVATYFLERVTGITADMFELIKSHYRRLDLLERFQAKSAEVFSETRSIIATHLRAGSRDRIKEYLDEESKRLARVYSSNYWKSVLHEEMATDSRFIDGCT